MLSLSCFGQEDLDFNVEITNQSGINSAKSEFSPVFWRDYLVFVSNNNNYSKSEYFNLYVAGIDKDDNLDRSALLSRVLTSDFHEGPASFSNQGNHIYFTRLDLVEDELNPDKDEVVKLKIYESNFSNGEWTSPTQSALNQLGVSSCHPSISPKGEFIVFASDRPDGYGKMDLYISEKVNGQWTDGINLGPDINSEANEWFPYLSGSNHLYFASDKEDNQLDLYLAKIDGILINSIDKLPYPFNSEFDDFGIVCFENGKHGYFSSNRPGGKGADDIYTFKSERPLVDFKKKEKRSINLDISSSDKSLHFQNCQIKYRSIYSSEIEMFNKSLFDISRYAYDSINVDEFKTYAIPLKSEYTLIEVQSEDSELWQMILSDQISDKSIDVVLIKKIEPKETQDLTNEDIIDEKNIEIGTVLIFENIYYAYNSSAIEEGAAKELDALAEAMLNNPKLKILLNAHTDSRGEAEYNLWLSQQRAENAKEYLIRKGVDPFNIRVNGSGEAQLRNHCKDGVFCSEAEHIYNRRTEVIVIDK